MKKAGSRNLRAGVCPHCGGKLPGEPDGKGRQGYALRRRRGLWVVVFGGEEAQFKHEKGVEYVARLLAERGPFHALDLASKGGGGWKRWRGMNRRRKGNGRWRGGTSRQS
jgi:uncharacterized protein YcaQ